MPFTRLSRATVTSNGSPRRSAGSVAIADARERTVGPRAATGLRAAESTAIPSGIVTEAIGVDCVEGGAQQVAELALEACSREHGERVGLPHQPLDEPGAEDVVLLEICRREGGSVEPPGRLRLAEHGVRVRCEREDNGHAEPAEDTGRGERADVGEPEMGDVERTVPRDRVCERTLDFPSVLPLHGGREIRVGAIAQAHESGASADRLLRTRVEAGERGILERPRERHHL